MSIFNENISNLLIKGGVGIIPTDTLYGLVGKSEILETVERIYKLRLRDIDKPCIILISSIEDLEKFDIELTESEKRFIIDNKIWPGKVSIVLPCSNPDFTYLHKGKNSIAFRVPATKELRDLIEKTGPLLAPSANIQGEPPAKNIISAKKYFEDSVDFYVDGGEIDSLPSTLMCFNNDLPVVLRKGAVKI
ncbi:MAG: L-threonylcarbamoyladenylate synthase [bacterium]|nr:L-threonylcarbamoyladenylate synthase [bacterium]